MKLILITLLGIVAVCHGGHAPGHVDECDECTEDFEGFGMPASKCGCCPWPCCCKCFNITTGPGGECRSLIDLLFILDSSGSIGEDDWNGPAKTFVQNVVAMFSDIGNDQQVAMITYSTNATLNWNWGSAETSSEESLNEAIQGLPLLGRFTNTVEAMELGVTEVIGGDNDRRRAPNVVIAMTDGRSNFREDEIPSMADRLQENALVIAIGVTNQIEMDELMAIASRPDLVFTVDEYDKLGSILEKVQNEVCPQEEVEEKCFCCCTPEQFFGGGGAYYYMKH